MSDVLNNLKELDALKVIIGPHMTEKSYANGSKNNQYIFKVIPRATKEDVKKAVELFFNVQVKAVNTLNVKGKVKSFKQRIGKRKSWKKAYVVLLDGNEIDFIGTGEKG